MWGVLLVGLVVCGAFGLKTITTDGEPTGPGETREGLPKLVKLTAQGCPTCLMLAPIIAQLEQEYRGQLVVETIDIYEQWE